MPVQKALVLLALIFPLISSVKIDIELLNNDVNDNCNKYTLKGAEFLTLTHARLLEYADDGRITANTLCNFKYKPNNPETKHTFSASCSSLGSPKWKNFVVLLSVTAQKQMQLGAIDYRYNKETMALDQFVDVDKLKSSEFEHTQHIQVKKIKLSGGVDKEIKFASCHKAYPSSLIGDHGLFVMKWDETKKGEVGWNRMYFDPAGLNEKIVF